jgi:protein-S-isoprenylcysteine O-methyltransferase Ste14
LPDAMGIQMLSVGAVSSATRRVKNLTVAAWSHVLELDNNLLGLIVCALAVYDWIVFYDKLDRTALYYSQHIYTLPSLSILAVLSSALYLTFGGIILLSLKGPLSRYATPLPNLVAVLAGFIVYVFALMPSGSVLRISVYLALSFVVLGTIIILISLVFLRQAFSITPQARFLVTSGPYALIRHPMYIGNILWLFGVALLIDSWQAIGFFFACAALQICRALYEENLLERTFPEYTAYKARTARFIPWPKLRWRFAFPLLALLPLVSTSPGDTAASSLYTAHTKSFSRCFPLNCSGPEVNDSVEFPRMTTEQLFIQLAANVQDQAAKCDEWYQKAMTDSWFNKHESEEYGKLYDLDGGNFVKTIPSCKRFDDLVDRCTQFIFKTTVDKRGDVQLDELSPPVRMKRLEENKGCVALAGFDTVCETLEAIARRGIVLSDYRRGLMQDCFSKSLRENRMSLLKPAI